MLDLILELFPDFHQEGEQPGCVYARNDVPEEECGIWIYVTRDFVEVSRACKQLLMRQYYDLSNPSYDPGILMCEIGDTIRTASAKS